MQMMKILNALALSVTLPVFLFSQSPIPAPAQSGQILILGAVAHIGNGNVIPNSAVAFDKGKITLVADATNIRLDRSQFQKIYDAAGKHVYPGFIAPNTQLGLIEIDAVRATNDKAETGAMNPNARAIVAYNSDSDITPTVRSNGALLAQICPEGGVLSGSSSVVQLDAWNWEDAAVKVDEGLHLNWPELRSNNGFNSANSEPKPSEVYDKKVDEIKAFFSEAFAYCQQAQPTIINLRFEALRALFSGSQTLYVHTNDAKTIRAAAQFAATFSLKMAIVGGNDAWQEAAVLKANNIPVILERTQRIPVREDEDIDQPYKTAKLLHEAGVVFAFSNNEAWQQRNLSFQAGQAVGAGLPYEAAVSALTLHTAQIMGISDRYGSLETGKSATLFISEGDALDMRTNQVTAAFIDGREISLDNKQKALNRKFSEKYKRGN